MAWSASRMAFQVSCCMKRPPVLLDKFDHFKTKLFSSDRRPLWSELQQLACQLNVAKLIKNASSKVLDSLVDSLFEFVDQPLLPSQSNFAPVDELKEAIVITRIEGEVPSGFPDGVYIRNGPNPLFGGLKSTNSVFGKTGHIWVEGEGMLHALYFERDSNGNWTIHYNNRHVETETFKLEKQRNKPSFLPFIDGDALPVFLACFLNMIRYGKANKCISNTNVFEHSGKFYSIADGDVPQEINLSTLETIGNWGLIRESWKRPFTSHPKRSPITGELVTVGFQPIKPYVQLGVISADGKRLAHKVDLKYERCSFCHEVGVTPRYNVIMDFPLTIDLLRLATGGPLLKHDKEDYARIGVMPRYGDAESIQWFLVEPCCMFHFINCFEDSDEVVVWGCRSLDSVIASSDHKDTESEWAAGSLITHKESAIQENSGSLKKEDSYFTRCYEWRLNMRTGEVKERNLTGFAHLCLEFPLINPAFTGIRNKFGYVQIVDTLGTAVSGLPKFSGIAKLYFDEQDTTMNVSYLTKLDSVNYKEGQEEGYVKVQHYILEKNTFCSGAAFVSREGTVEEDDGWIITFVHNEDTNISQVHVIDAKKFTDEPVAKITLPCRVPYGFHGAFMAMPLHNRQPLPV